MHRSWSLDRRTLLRWMAQGLVVVSAPELGCGKGEGGDDDGSGGGGGKPDDVNGVPGGGTAGAAVSDERRVEALKLVDSSLEELVGNGTTFDPDAMIGRLRASPAFSRVGYTASSRCGWAVFTDGRKVVIANNLLLEEPPDPPAGPAGLRAQRGLNADDIILCAPNFRNVNMLQELPVLPYAHITANMVEGDTLPRLSRVATAVGYLDVDLGTVPGSPSYPKLCDVEGLKDIHENGVLLLTSVGGTVNAQGEAIDSIWTLTPALQDEKVRPEYEAGLGSGALAYHAVPWVLEGRFAGTRLGITPQFLRTFPWSFPYNSLVYLNGPGMLTGDWVDAFNSAGAGMIMGWRGPVHIRTCMGATQDFFELGFGTNRFEGSGKLKKEPPYRGIGMGSTLNHQDQNGYLRGELAGGDGVSFEYLPRSPGIVNQLRPNISYLSPNIEKGEMEMIGEFGVESAEVRIGPSLKAADVPELEGIADRPLTSQQTLRIREWKSNRIVVELPEGQDGSGIVQVWNGRVFGNALPITQWKIEFELERTVGGALHRSASMDVTVRAACAGYRLQFDQDEFAQLDRVFIQNDLLGDIGYSGSGSMSKTEGDVTTKTTWSGVGNFGRNEGTNLFSFSGEIQLKNRVLSGNVLMAAGQGLHVKREVTRDGKTTVELDADSPFGLMSKPDLGLGGFSFKQTLDENWNLPAGAVSWDEMEDVSGFGQQVARNTLTWKFAAPKFPLEKDLYGR